MIIENRSKLRSNYKIPRLNEDPDIQNLLFDIGKKFSSSKAIFRIANILICLSHGIGAVTDIANLCKVNKSTIHRLLKALCEAGITGQDPVSHEYYLGPLISKLASNPHITHENLIICAVDELRHLAAYTGETVGLAGLIGFQQVSLYEIPSTQDFRIVVNQRFPENMHAGATAKVLLSQLGSKELKIVVSNMDFKPMTDRTVTYKDLWLAQLRQAKEQGYSVSYGERILGAMCVSFPIKNYIFPVAIDMVGPEARVKPKLNDFVNELTASSERIQQNLTRISRIK
jgi:DNA-binding IclR family transcriptional regulator